MRNLVILHERRSQIRSNFHIRMKNMTSSFEEYGPKGSLGFLPWTFEKDKFGLTIKIFLQLYVLEIQSNRVPNALV